MHCCHCVLCCAVLCCAVLCCAALCCAVLRCAALCCAVLRCAVLRCAVLRCSIPSQPPALQCNACSAIILAKHQLGAPSGRHIVTAQSMAVLAVEVRTLAAASSMHQALWAMTTLSPRHTLLCLLVTRMLECGSYRPGKLSHCTCEWHAGMWATSQWQSPPGSPTTAQQQSSCRGCVS